MSARRPDPTTRIDRATAERILGGDLADPPAGPDDLVRLLAAAAAPASAAGTGALAQGGEIAGEEAAVAAFLRARLAPPAQPRRDLMIKTALAKVLTMKIAAAALAAVTAGGVWAATQTSALRGLIGNAASSARPAVTHSPARSAPPDERAAYRIAALAGVCEAYLSESNRPSVPGPKIASEFGALIAAAGGTQAKAGAYCRGLLRALRHRYPAGLPSHLPARLPAGSSAKLPTSLPILPTALPTSPPTPVPTILPTGLPIPSPTILPSVPIPHPDQ